MSLSHSEFREISLELEKYHGVFATLWQFGRIQFVDNIPTAAIQFDEYGDRVAFLFNEKWWKSLDLYNKCFFICHECLHVILNHGVRTVGTAYKQLCNIVLDVVVHNILINNFKFQREKIENWEKFCWLDKVFPKEDMPNDESFEFYFNRLKNKCSAIELSKFQLADSHEWFEGQSSGEIIDKLNKGISNEEKESLRDTIEKHYTEESTEGKEGGKKAGTEKGGKWVFAKKGNVVKKKKWETIIKQWSKKFKDKSNDTEQWARINRRLAVMPTSLILPSDMEEDARDDDRIEVWFFQDTSGSCEGFKDRFFHAAESLPKEKFDVKMFCFDTKVYETTLESRKLYGFGGTAYNILEEKIQSMKEETARKQGGDSYPKAIFVITDGEGNSVKPENPKRWYWFLSNNYTYYIPKESNVFQLKDFE